MVKELSSRWFVSAYDHILSQSDIIKNGFKKAGKLKPLKMVFWMIPLCKVPKIVMIHLIQMT